MLATRVSQKESLFYFAAYPAAELLKKVRFTTRFEAEEGRIASAEPDPSDEIGGFISKVEHSDKAFQRGLAKAKVAQIRNFYETCGAQPMIPGTVLLFTSERLVFNPSASGSPNGSLTAPDGKYLIIDGQHRLAALHFHLKKHPEEAGNVHVPCVIFDGRNEDFAAEMFVIINSTPTRINKSHLIDLYERVSFATPDKKLAAKIVDRLYGEGDSPLRYRINRLGGRSGKEKWILQAELFNEVHRWVKGSESAAQEHVEHHYAILRDFLKASAAAWGEAWGSDSHMVTKPVTLKALIRVCADLAESDADPAEGRVKRWTARLAPWAERTRDFKADGFYERFAAKGQIERVQKIHRELGRLIAG
jgi:DGQHR domain-containing protein